MQIKKNSIRFDAGAWLSDAKLRSCSLEARGLLIDLMAMASQNNSDFYGILTIPPEDIRKIIASANYQQALTELIEKKRIVKSNLGWCLPRMIRDCNYYMITIDEQGRAVLTTKTQKPTIPNVTVNDYIEALPKSLQHPLVIAAIKEWWEYRERKKIVITKPTIHRQIAKLSPLSPFEAVVWIRYAMERQWQSFYRPKPIGQFTLNEMVEIEKYVYELTEIAKTKSKEELNQYWYNLRSNIPNVALQKEIAKRVSFEISQRKKQC